MDLTAITFTELRYVVVVAEAQYIGRAAASLASTRSVVARPFRSPAPHRRIGLEWRRRFADAGLRELTGSIRARVPDVAQAVEPSRSEAAS